MESLLTFFTTHIGTLDQLSYFGLFLFLFGSVIFIPIPEEVTLLTAGTLIALGILNPFYAVPLAIVALLLGDSFLFFLAKTGARYAHKLHLKVQKLGLEKTWLLAPSHSLRAVFFLRFITGIRVIAPLYAGFNNASWKGFLLTTFLSVLILVPGLLFMGYLFHESFIVFLATFEVVRHALFAALLAYVGGGMFVTLWNRLRKKEKREEV